MRPQKTRPRAKRRHMKYKPSKSAPPVRHVGESKKQKKHGKKTDSGKLAIPSDHPRCRSAIWISMCGHIPEAVTCSTFHRNPFKGFGAIGCQSLPSPKP